MQFDANQGWKLRRNYVNWGCNCAQWCKSALSCKKDRLFANQKGAIGLGSQQNCQVMPFSITWQCLTFRKGYVIPKGHHLWFSCGSLSILVGLNSAHFHIQVPFFIFLQFSAPICMNSLQRFYIFFSTAKNIHDNKIRHKTFCFKKNFCHKYLTHLKT